MKENRITFELGQIWTNNRGEIHKVVEMLDWNDGDGFRKAVLRRGITGDGEKRVRLATSTNGWRFVKDTPIR